MKSLTIILTTLSFLALKTGESAAQPPLRLEPIEVQDVSEGLPSSTPDWELEIGKYFEGQDDEEPADAELIPLGESEQEAKEKSKQKDKDELEEDKDESDEEQSEEDEEKAAQAARNARHNRNSSYFTNPCTTFSWPLVSTAQKYPRIRRLPCRRRCPRP